MKKLILFSCFVFIFFGAFSQRSKKDSLIVDRKNELLLNCKAMAFTQSSIYGENFNYGFMYRRTIKKNAIRATINFIDFTRGQGSSTDYRKNNSNYLSTGIQRNIPGKKVFQFYWGGDLFYANYNASERFQTATGFDYSRKEITKSIGLAPFFGLKTTILNRIIIGVEQTSVLSYNENTKYYGPSNAPASPSKSSSMNFNLFNGLRFMAGIKF